ncbi:MAG: thiol-disulfide isomerase/thioredoxin [Flavobacteriales bacterium]|jgi:thiol-disulfide isomerase/thioredoxin|tara:strand:+ start:2511 stop:3503 length:993 start_codon:yes stop_codon:yes gene_type:complete
MKKLIILLLIVSTITSCKEPKGYVTVSGEIENNEAKEITISSKSFSKTINLDEKGTFKDTLKIEKGLYTLSDGVNKTLLFLANGYDLKINSNSDLSDIEFKGKGEESNSFIAQRVKSSKTDLFNPKAYFSLERDAFDLKIKEIEQINSSYSNENVDSSIIAQIQNEDKRFIDYLTKNYESKYASLIKFAKGKPSPKFSNFENYNGGTTSLVDLKGKYVYIDVWATWCGPCKVQIPYLKQIEEEYHGKNIEFVSISTDRRNKYQAWKNMIENKEMGGIQLFAGEDQSFSQAYDIRGIPRFILIDPEGNIVDANAPRPSEPRLKELFNSLNI